MEFLVIEMSNVSKNVTVSVLEPSHLGEVAELERLCFSEPWSEQALCLLTEEAAIAYVLCEDGHVVAYGGMTTVLDEGAVTNIAVHPTARRNGYGRRVTQALLDGAREKGIQSVFLEVRESNVAARALYDSLGFRACGIRKNFYRHPVESAIQMVWSATDALEHL